MIASRVAFCKLRERLKNSVDAATVEFWSSERARTPAPAGIDSEAAGLAEHLPRHGAVAALALSALTRAGSLRLIKVDCRDTNRILGPFSALAKNDSTCDHKRLVVASLFRNVSDLLQDTAKDNDFRNMTSEVEETR